MSAPDVAAKPTPSELEMLRLPRLLSRDERARAHMYAPAQPQDRHQAGLIKDLIHKASSGSGEELVLAALRGQVSTKEREQIQQILNGEAGRKE